MRKDPRVVRLLNNLKRRGAYWSLEAFWLQQVALNRGQKACFLSCRLTEVREILLWDGVEHAWSPEMRPLP